MIDDEPCIESHGLLVFLLLEASRRRPTEAVLHRQFHALPRVLLECACVRILDSGLLLTCMRSLVQEKFLQSRIKVGGKLNNLGEKVEISREKAKLCVTAELPFSKRYLKVIILFRGILFTNLV